MKSWCVRVVGCGMLFVLHLCSFLPFPLCLHLHLYSSSSYFTLRSPLSQFPSWTSSSLILTHQQLSQRRTKEWRVWMGRIMDNKYEKDRCRHSFCIYLSFYYFLTQYARMCCRHAGSVSDVCLVMRLDSHEVELKIAHSLCFPLSSTLSFTE